MTIPDRPQEVWEDRIEAAANTIINMWDEAAEEAADGDYHENMLAMLDPILRGMVFDEVASPEELKPDGEGFHPWERPKDEIDRQVEDGIVEHEPVEECCDRCGGVLYSNGFQIGNCNCPPPPEDGDADLFVRRPR